MVTPAVRTETSGQVTTVILSRPERRNALTIMTMAAGAALEIGALSARRGAAIGNRPGRVSPGRVRPGRARRNGQARNVRSDIAYTPVPRQRAGTSVHRKAKIISGSTAQFIAKLP